MLTTMMMMMLTGTMVFVFLKHPMSMGFMLLIQTIIIALTMGYFNLNFWYSYILFLVMIGGMMVLFIYMTSVASNEKFMFSIKIMGLIICMTLMTLWMLYYLDPYFTSINNLELESFNNNSDYTLSLNKYINTPLITIMFMVIIYLLITLIAVVKITHIKSGPLRQTN
nr:NADH dehydrogenase subunit 6 [Amphimallon sp.]